MIQDRHAWFLPGPASEICLRRSRPSQRSRSLRRANGCVILALCMAIGPAVIAQTSELVFDLRIVGGRVAQKMRVIRVKQGDAVRLRWTSDRPIVVHLHGYDIERKVEPGNVTEMAFEARATGRFDVEEHKPNVEGGHPHGAAPLVRVEVRPR